MRSLRSFLLDAYWAYDALAEAEGFKSGAEKRRKKRKEFLSAREKKIQKLKNRSQHWAGLK